MKRESLSFRCGSGGLGLRSSQAAGFRTAQDHRNQHSDRGYNTGMSKGEVTSEFSNYLAHQAPTNKSYLILREQEITFGSTLQVFVPQPGLHEAGCGVLGGAEQQMAQLMSSSMSQDRAFRTRSPFGKLLHTE